MVTVRGLDDIDRMLAAIVRGEIAPHVVDMLNCEGCIDGPAVNPEHVGLREAQPHRRRARAPAATARRQPHVPLGAAADRAAPRTSRPSRWSRASPPPRRSTRCWRRASSRAAPRRSTAGRAASTPASSSPPRSAWATRRGSGASRCSASGCSASTTSSTEVALLDPLTGLGNRRAFDARLAEEVSRADALRDAALARDGRPRRLQGDQRPARPHRR